MAGTFVVFEGIDGSGKSTTIAALSKRLASKGYRCVGLREPTEKTDASREIRRILRTVKDIDAALSKELLDLFLIDRLWDIENQIKPAIQSGAVVLLDRYFFSTAAYQAMNTTQIHDIIANYLNDTRILLPALIVYLDLPVKIALERLKSRTEFDVFENESRLTRIAENYREMFGGLKITKPEIRVNLKTNALVAADFEELSAQIQQLTLASNR